MVTSNQNLQCLVIKELRSNASLRLVAMDQAVIAIPVLLCS